jgi:hypothetical protein
MKLDFTDSCPHQHLSQLALLTVIQLYYILIMKNVGTEKYQSSLFYCQAHYTAIQVYLDIDIG